MAKTRKVQVTLDEAQYEALAQIAERDGKKLAAVVRESVVQYCLGPESRKARRRALKVLQEILHRYFSIGRPGSARRIHRSAIDLCDEVLPIEVAHTTLALELLVEHPQLTPRDAIHVATMQRQELELLLSTDQDFDGIGLVQRIDPADFAG